MRRLKRDTRSNRKLFVYLWGCSIKPNPVLVSLAVSLLIVLGVRFRGFTINSSLHTSIFPDVQTFCHD
jgi:hypothetical protein